MGIGMRRARGGALFTMVLFLLLLITSGLMYFYFMKARMLERELEQWRAGIKVQETTRLVKTGESPAPTGSPANNPPSTPTPMPAPPVPDGMPDGELPAPPLARTSPAAPPTRSPAVSDEVIPGLGQNLPAATPSTPAESAAPAPRVTPRPRASATPAADSTPPARKPSGPIRSAYDLAEPQPMDNPTPVPTVRVPRRPSQPPRPGAVSDLLLGRDRNEIED
jgi:hypothetical protein